MTLFLFPLMCAICAYAISKILITDGMILWPVFNKVVNDWNCPLWLHKPLMTCAYCVAGQWALWGYLYKTISIKGSIDFSNSITAIIDITKLHIISNNYNVLHHVWVILFAVFCVEVILWLLSLSFSIEIQNKINKCSHGDKASTGN